MPTTTRPNARLNAGPHLRVLTATLATGLAAGAATSATAQASDLFSISAVATNGTTLTVGGNSLPDLINDLSDQQFDFSALDGLAFTATVRYAGVENAIVVMYNPDTNGDGSNIESIDIELLGVNVDIGTFTETPEESLGDQLEDFFLQDNPGIISSFQAALNRESSIAVGDGNPLSVTARSANYKFNRFGMFQDGTPTSAMIDRRFSFRSGGIQLEGPESSPIQEGSAAQELTDFRLRPQSLGARRVGAAVSGGGGGGGGASDYQGRFRGATQEGRAVRSGGGRSVGWFRSRVDVSASSFEADSGNLEGYDITVAPSWETAYSESFSLVLGLPFAYHEVEGAQVYNAGVHLDAPIRIIKPSSSDLVGVTWQITPGASLDVGGSFDFAAGGVVFSYGATNLLGFSFGDFDLALPTGFYSYESVAVETEEIEFDAGIEQQIFKQGARLTYHPGDRFQVFGGITYTDFIQDAAIDNFWTPTAGLGWVFANGATITLAYEGDIDPNDRFERHGGRLNLNIPF